MEEREPDWSAVETHAGTPEDSPYAQRMRFNRAGKEFLAEARSSGITRGAKNGETRTRSLGDGVDAALTEWPTESTISQLTLTFASGPKTPDGLRSLHIQSTVLGTDFRGIKIRQSIIVSHHTKAREEWYEAQMRLVLPAGFGEAVHLSRYSSQLNAPKGAEFRPEVIQKTVPELTRVLEAFALAEAEEAHEPNTTLVEQVGDIPPLTE